MPRYARYAKKAYRSKPVRNRVKIYGRAGYQLYKDVSYIKSLVNSELHYINNTYTGQAISSSGTILHLSATTQGNTNANRSGNSILPRYLNIFLKFEQGSVTDLVRCMLFRWKDNSTPTISDIFENASAPVYSTLNDNISGNNKDRKIDVLANKRLLIDTTERDAVLWKKMIDLNPPSKNVKDHIKYDDNTSTAPLGGIYLLIVGRQPTTTTDMEGNIKFSFHDN